jgi:CheY-like chemotaxis protein
MAQRSPLQGGRALIVDDEIFFALNLEADMHALGFDICDLAPNGQQASQLAMNNQPDVVLMDINLEGGREGIEVARWLRTVCDAPVIFISGYADRETVERVHERVPDAPVLSKPVYGQRLTEAVAAVIPPHH